MNGRPMCWSWYERAGSYRPWHDRAEGCTCGAGAHAASWQHREDCPLFASEIATGDAER